MCTFITHFISSLSIYMYMSIVNLPFICHIVSIHPSIYMYISCFLHLSIHSFIYLLLFPLHLSIYSSIYLFIYPSSIHSVIHLSTPVSSSSIHSFIHLSIYPFIHSPIHSFIRLFIHSFI